MYKGKFKAVQYNACLAITGVIRRTSQRRLYCELGLKTLNDCRWSCKLFFFHKIVKVFSASYLQEIVCFRNMQHCQTSPKSTKITEQIRAKSKDFENSFFPD